MLFLSFVIFCKIKKKSSAKFFSVFKPISGNPKKPSPKFLSRILSFQDEGGRELTKSWAIWGLKLLEAYHD